MNTQVSLKKPAAGEKVRVLFINPPLSQTVGNPCTNIKFPLGFLYLASTLEKNGFGARILDCPLEYGIVTQSGEDTVKIGLTLDAIRKVIADYDPHIIGVSCAYTMYEADSFELIDDIKKNFPSILLVVGGAQSSANPAYVLRNRNIDIVVIGEGEITMLEIAQRFRDGGALQDLKGTAVMENDQPKINERREYIANLDEQDAAWHLLDMAKYFAHPYNSNATMRRNAVDITTSRGCPGNCIFCSIHTVWGRKWRARSPKHVVDELELLYTKYGARQFRMQDDNLTMDKARIMAICDEIIRRKLDIRWDTPNGIALWALNNDVLLKMKQAGCYRVTFGIESACHNSQKYIGKILDMKKINDTIDFCHQIGLWVCATFIIGFPDETLEDIRVSERFVVESKINFPFIYIAQPMQGTRLYEDFKAKDLLKGDFRHLSGVAQTKYNTRHFKWHELNALLKEIYRKFYIHKTLAYLNPLRFYREFLSKIRSWEDLQYVLRMLAEIWHPLKMKTFSKKSVGESS